MAQETKPQNTDTKVQAQAADPKAQAPAKAVEQFFRVAKEATVPRKGSSYILPAGKILSDRGYDIASLKQYGVQLVPVQQGVPA